MIKSDPKFKDKSLEQLENERGKETRIIYLISSNFIITDLDIILNKFLQFIIIIVFKIISFMKDNCSHSFLIWELKNDSDDSLKFE